MGGGGDSPFVRPNVSYCTQENEDHYNPIIPPDYSQEYLTFVAKADGTFKFSGNSINYSIDNGNTWTSLASNTDTPTVTSGSKILWKASGLTPTSSAGIGRFSASTQFEVYGNAMSLVSGDSFSEATTLSLYQFRNLFSGCTGLTNAENLSLPALAMKTQCYFGMFQGCTNLTTAPQLPATTLSANCYSYMFLNCTNLTTAPSLPATTLKISCYNYMFQGCTSLTTAPELLATTLVTDCYNSMFKGCTSLNYIKAMFTTTPNGDYTGSWVEGVASSGTFVKNSVAMWDVSGANGVPNGWTVETASA